MNFRWLSGIDPDSMLFQRIVGHLSTIDPKNWSKEKIIEYLRNKSYDCFLGFERGKIAAWWAVNKDARKGVLKGFMIYTHKTYRNKGFGRTITAELAKRAHSEGFKFAQLGKGRGKTAKILESTQKHRKSLGAHAFRFDSRTGRVSFPKAKKPR